MPTKVGQLKDGIILKTVGDLGISLQIKKKGLWHLDLNLV